MTGRRYLVALVVVGAALGRPGWAAEPGEEIEVTSGAVTALPCALKAKATGKLDAVSSCPMADAAAGYAVFDLATKDVYVLSGKKVHRYELELAFGGGSVDFSGVVVETSDGVAVIDVAEYSISLRPKPGAFKGCL